MIIKVGEEKGDEWFHYTSPHLCKQICGKPAPAHPIQLYPSHDSRSESKRWTNNCQTFAHAFDAKSTIPPCKFYSWSCILTWQSTSREVLQPVDSVVGSYTWTLGVSRNEHLLLYFLERYTTIFLLSWTKHTFYVSYVEVGIYQVPCAGFYSFKKYWISSLWACRRVLVSIPSL